MSIYEAWLFLRIFLIIFLFILFSELGLMILNFLPTINFKWSLRFLKLGKFIMIGIFVLFYNIVKNESWFV